jgi:succinate dehydrogenase/fumarate reductase cytochrome b subunit
MELWVIAILPTKKRNVDGIRCKKDLEIGTRIKIFWISSYLFHFINSIRKLRKDFFYYISKLE